MKRIKIVAIGENDFTDVAERNEELLWPKQSFGDGAGEESPSPLNKEFSGDLACIQSDAGKSKLT